MIKIDSISGGKRLIKKCAKSNKTSQINKNANGNVGFYPKMKIIFPIVGGVSCGLAGVASGVTVLIGGVIGVVIDNCVGKSKKKIVLL